MRRETGKTSFLVFLGHDNFSLQLETSANTCWEIQDLRCCLLGQGELLVLILQGNPIILVQQRFGTSLRVVNGEIPDRCHEMMSLRSKATVAFKNVANKNMSYLEYKCAKLYTERLK